jgi:ubiquitin-protein ligase E3 D
MDTDQRTDPTRAMKILWKRIDNAEEAVAQRGQLSVETVYLPANVFEEIETGLGKSSVLLPASARSFNVWDVGLLERFSSTNGQRVIEPGVVDP